ncbi:hypothetical protein AgCh_031005 [Apium graveolens]
MDATSAMGPTQAPRHQWAPLKMPRKQWAPTCHVNSDPHATSLEFSELPSAEFNEHIFIEVCYFKFFLQPLTLSEAAASAKVSPKEIINGKEFINKKALPFVQMDLRLKASYLHCDLNTIIASKPKDEKRSLQALTEKLYNVIDICLTNSFTFFSQLDYATKTKSSIPTQKQYLP